MTTREMDRCKKTLAKFKNAVMYYLHSNRKEKKLPKLKDVLEKVIAKAEAVKRASREKSDNPLEKLMGNHEDTLQPENFFTLRDNLNRINLDIGENNQQAFLLEGKLNWVLRPPEKMKIREKRKKPGRRGLGLKED